MATQRDTLFGQFAIERGFITKQQLAEAVENQRTMEAMGIRHTIAVVLAGKSQITKDQAQELNHEVAVKTGEASLVAGYEVISKLGQGGMGAVYKARRTSTGEFVALKILPPSLATKDLIARFRRESEIVGRLSHRHIVGFVEFGRDEKRKCYFCALELVEGEDLGKKISREGAFPDDKAVSITTQIAEALQHAHYHGLVHRDIKPENIMVSPDGTAKLLDLGLARSADLEATRYTQTGMFVGSPYYCSPEQAKGKREIDIRSDIYALGATLFCMVTGRPPFKAATALAVLQMHVYEKTPPIRDINPQVPERLSQVIEKMMAKDPAERYQTPIELIEALGGTSERPGRLRPAPPGPDLRPGDEVEITQTREGSLLAGEPEEPRGPPVATGPAPAALRLAQDGGTELVEGAAAAPPEDNVQAPPLPVAAVVEESAPSPQGAPVHAPKVVVVQEGRAPGVVVVREGRAPEVVTVEEGPKGPAPGALAPVKRRRFSGLMKAAVGVGVVVAAVLLTRGFLERRRTPSLQPSAAGSRRNGPREASGTSPSITTDGDRRDPSDGAPATRAGDDLSAARVAGAPGDGDGRTGRRAPGKAGSRDARPHALRGATAAVPTAWPFDDVEARRRQEGASGLFGLPVERRLDLDGTTLKLVLVPGGEFVIGSSRADRDRAKDEGPQHRVRIAHCFYLGVTEVTQAQWRSVMDDNPSRFKGDGLPAEQVSWHDCQEFLEVLSERTGLTCRLPTEAEWEYACRAGTNARFSFGGDDSALRDNAWSRDNSDGRTHEVGALRPNAWGIYDMHGNVWEWCSDRHGLYPAGLQVDPTGVTGGVFRVLRGGSWGSGPEDCRCAKRGRGHPDDSNLDIGFRVVVPVSP